MDSLSLEELEDFKKKLQNSEKFATRKIWNQQEYFSHINIPESWDNLTAFADWYMESKMPMMLPVGSPVYVTNDATAIVVFRKGQYQVELYIIHGKTMVGKHFHPGMEVITMQIGNMDDAVWGMYSHLLEDGESHDGDFSCDIGAAFLTFEKWFDESKMTSAAVNWKGKTSGDIHDELIRKYRPDAFVENNYADVSITNKKV